MNRKLLILLCFAISSTVVFYGYLQSLQQQLTLKDNDENYTTTTTLQLPMAPVDPKRRIDERGFIVQEAPFDRELLQSDHICIQAVATDPTWVADDRGYLCARTEVNGSTNCCQNRYRYSCLACHNVTKCCGLYASCITCCMRSNLAFDDCASRCRASSKTLIRDDSPWLKLVPHCWQEAITEPNTRDSIAPLSSSSSSSPPPYRPETLRNSTDRVEWIEKF